MKVQVLLFAAHREMLAANRLEIEVPPITTAAGVFEALTLQEPRLAQLRPFTTYAVNREVVSADHLLAPGDEVALLQPVSGGVR